MFLFTCQPKTIATVDSTKKNDTTLVKKTELLLSRKLKIAAYRFDNYVPLLQNKNVALVVNNTSLVGEKHLVDTLLDLGVKVTKIFAPEHGFRGNVDAGVYIENAIDAQTGLPIISLYGKNKKPTAFQLQDIDVVLYDIQDVGVRFYTYISTMHLVMEACAENNKVCFILDRPNPNASYVDGPVREYKYKSYVGMHPIPIVYGLTSGELALMINGEKWLRNGISCSLQVIPLENYSHYTEYVLPVKPSPNLTNHQAIQLYPSTCLFEGTALSVGRGTEYPFLWIGGPQKTLGNFSFTPRSIEGMAKNPKFLGETCYGLDLRESKQLKGINLKYLIEMYGNYQEKDKFFNGYFNTLAGTADLRRQIEQGMNEREIKKTWEPGLEVYKELRNKYLLYP